MDRSAQDLVEQVRGIVDTNRYLTLATADGDGPLGDTGLVCPRGLHRLPLGVATGGPPLPQPGAPPGDRHPRTKLVLALGLDPGLVDGAGGEQGDDRDHLAADGDPGGVNRGAPGQVAVADDERPDRAGGHAEAAA